MKVLENKMKSQKRLSNDLKKIFKKPGCVHGKPRARRRRPTSRLTLAQRKTTCQRGLPGFFINTPPPKKKGTTFNT
jgi:hypothetical protein